jgi:UDP-N-acetylmuramate--alanine ligase
MNYMSPQNRFVKRMQRVHMIGIGGSGMSGIAEVLHNLGFVVTGSDQKLTATTERLQDMGICVYPEHNARWVEEADVVVYSSAIPVHNPEMEAAHALRKPLLSRAEMLAELMRFKVGIAVAGTHGKTTTTSLIASVLAAGGLDPTFVIGGLLNSAGTHAALGNSEYLVAEADESDGSFQLLQPVLAVVTNIDADHMETFGGDFQQLQQAFDNFLHHLPFYGVAALCVDDPAVAQLAQTLPRHTIGYGLGESAALRAVNVQQQGHRMRFDVSYDGQLLARDVELNLPGRHNVQNALAALAIGLEMNVEMAAMTRALSEFAGIGRRFNRYPELMASGGQFTLIDDYAHHPTELKSVIAAIREGWPDNRLVLVFQPHRYSRTRDLFDEFSQVLDRVDALLVTDVYAAGEAPLGGATAPDLCRSIRSRGRLEPVYVGSVEAVPETLDRLIQADDIVLLAGAGDIASQVRRIVSQQGTCPRSPIPPGGREGLSENPPAATPQNKAGGRHD